VPLVYGRVQVGGVQIAHSALQRGAVVNRAAAGESEARIGDAHTGRGDPYRSLRPLGNQGLFSQGARERVAPMAATWASSTARAARSSAETRPSS
jgi:hypothetical protein